MSLHRLALASLPVLLLATTGCITELTPDPVEVKLPSADVRLAQDDLGITHVYAQNDADALFGAGYAMARDRLFQMELARRQAMGTSAEVLGKNAVGGDRGARVFNFKKLGEQDAARYKSERPEEEKLLEAWVAGVNARIAEVSSGKVPRPYGFGPAELDFVPDPWTSAHAFAVGKVLAFGLSSSLDSEILATAIDKLVPKAFGLGLIQPTFDTFTTQPAKKGHAPTHPQTPSHAPVPYEFPAGWKYQPTAPQLGSNNWAVEGAHTDTGKPYLCGDPHQALTSPTRFWPFHMSSIDGGGTLDVIGFAFVGTPTVELGHNEHIGWTATTNFADVTDIYDVDMPLQATSATIGGQTFNVTTRTETIDVKGDMAVTLDVSDVDGFGVVLPDEILPAPTALLAKGRLVVKWTGFDPSIESAAYLGLDRAQNLDDFESAADKLEVGAVNFVAASKDGIDYHVHSNVPDRGAPSSRPMPWKAVDGADPANLWSRGFLGPDKLPHLRDPSSGYIVTANNDPWGFTSDNNVENDPFYYGAFYDKGFRSHRIEDRLKTMIASGTKIDRKAMEDLQGDTFSALAETLVPALDKAITDAATDPNLSMFKGRTDLQGVVARLKAWDKRFDHASAEPVLLFAVEWFAMQRVMVPLFTQPIFNAIQGKSPAFLAGVFRNLVLGQIANGASFFPGGVDATLLASLDDTAQWITKRFGKLDASFTMADYHFANFEAFYPGKLEATPLVVNGHLDTINVSESRFSDDNGMPLDKSTSHDGSLYRMVVGFGADGFPEATLDFARGTSGEPGDAHFGDQDTVWSTAGHVALPFRKADVDARTKATVVLPKASQ